MSKWLLAASTSSSAKGVSLVLSMDYAPMTSNLQGGDGKRTV
jgi:hypothetical protein